MLLIDESLKSIAKLFLYLIISYIYNTQLIIRKVNNLT